MGETLDRGAQGARPELLAPAGNLTALLAAVDAGADAVYVGLRHLSARAHTTNLSLNELEHGCRVAGERGARVYVTLNTLVRPEECGDAVRLARAAQAAGAAAVVVQDLGLLSLLRAEMPDLDVHASTQMALHGPEDVRQAWEMGLRRVVLARELGLQEIAAVARAVPECELEVFVHGALCYAVSGLCLASALTTGRSGNRGRCTQPCRRPFHDDAGHEGLVFSLTDLWGLEHVAALTRAGVASLKIEGRLRAPGYVSAVVRTYRRALDGGDTADQDDRNDAGARAVRSQFSRRVGSGYLHGPNTTNAARVDPHFQGHRGFPVGRVVAQRASGDLLVEVEAPFAAGDRVLVDRGDHRPYNLEVPSISNADGEPVEHAVPGHSVSLPRVPATFPAGSRVYLVTSRAVKTASRTQPPNLEGTPVQVTATVRPNELTLRAKLGNDTLAHDYDLPADPRIAALDRGEIRRVLEERGEGPEHLQLRSVRGNPADLRVPPKALRRVRRDFVRRVGLALDLDAAPARSLPNCPTPGPWTGASEWIVRVACATQLTPEVRQLAARVQVVAAPGAEHDVTEVLRAAGDLPVEVVVPPYLPMRRRRRYAEWLASESSRVAGFVVGALGHLALVPPGRPVAADHTLYVANPWAHETLARRLGLRRATAPIEADRALLEALGSCIGAWLEVVVFGHPVVMYGETHPAWRDGSRPPSGTVVEDERGQRFRLTVRGDGVTEVTPERPYALTAQRDELRRAGYGSFRVDFSHTTYRRERIARVLAAATAGEPLEGTSTGNYEGTLL